MGLSPSLPLVPTKCFCALCVPFYNYTQTLTHPAENNVQGHMILANERREGLCSPRLPSSLRSTSCGLDEPPGLAF